MLVVFEFTYFAKDLHIKTNLWLMSSFVQDSKVPQAQKLKVVLMLFKSKRVFLVNNYNISIFGNQCWLLKQCNKFIEI